MNLAARLRPQTLDEFYGQEHLIGPNSILRKMIESQTISSMIFWGPPGSGKTTLANLIAKSVKANFYHLSAVETGKADLQKIIREAEKQLSSLSGDSIAKFIPDRGLQNDKQTH